MKIRVRRFFSGRGTVNPQTTSALLIVTVAVLSLVVWKVGGVEPAGRVPPALIAAPAAAVVLAGCAVGLFLLGLIARLISSAIWYAIGVGVLGVSAVLALQGAFIPMALLMGLVIGPVHVLLGAGLGAVISALGSRNDPRKRAVVRRALQMVFAPAAIGIYAAWLFWFLYPGSDSHLAPPPQPVSADADVAAAQWALLAEHGEYRVERSSYGPGNDLRREEYGSDVDIVTETVDLSALLSPAAGLEGSFRRSYWGFDITEAPLGGVVWAPEAATDATAGVHPLVLIVHGNQPMHRRAELGYDYLAEQLASHGYIAVSVDQSFLNFSWLGEGYGRQEIPARAWLLLEHLRRWKQWNGDPTSRWFGRVDLSRIALIGHSRGGEAVAVAAHFNELSANPEKPAMEFNFGFDIRGVVALAPSDGFYRPGGGAIELPGVDYLVLHGGHDGDVPLFMGLAQYERVKPLRNGFKALVYIYRGSHGGFSTIPQRMDISFPFGRLLNSAPLLEPAQQQALARLYVTAFAEASLRGRQQARTVFQGPRAALQLTPDEWVLQRYRDGRRLVIADFDADRDPRVEAEGRARFSAVGLKRWENRMVALRAFGKETGNRARLLSWPDRTDQPEAHFAISVAPATAAAFSSRGELLFSLADMRVPPPGELLRPPAIELVLLGPDGTGISVALESLQPLPPPLVVQYTKLGPIERALMKPVESVLHSYRIPLEPAANAGLLPSAINEIRFVFDIDQPGTILLDEVGYTVAQ